MFEGFVTKLLNQYLGEIVEGGFDKEQLKVAVWKGHVKLENLKIRQAVFRISFQFEIFLNLLNHPLLLLFVLLELPCWMVFSCPSG